MTRNIINYRMMNDIDTSQLSIGIRQDLYESLELEEDVNQHAGLLENVLKKHLDIHAPLKSKTVTERINHPWYMKDVREQRHKMRNREKTRKSMAKSINGWYTK